ncbi:mitochondrial MRF1 N(5)-glutamine methyltransferase Mtq1p [[Candida] jaroonii]|uniref:Mitochondrial MRF1 N(5)-glutamine methyltransferase Mtq1p n=1 Tax=[Candida] jaroonii TaxID=467808 RepID=A0ACA9Y5W4_9ASCO|nr:mitochondrial MRF1 N(5)-glutamine methyltransferase Mtq1p [[Candida] jaroonii]
MRISPKLIRQARQINNLLPPLLYPNRSLEQAQLELKWITEELPPNQWVQAVKRRSLYEPLQYILGSQPFGDLDILCRPGVLIPRWETEEWVKRLCNSLSGQQYKILDVCTGSGCIPILMDHLLKQRGIDSNIEAFDISPIAVELAQENAKLNQSSISFTQNNLFRVRDLGKYDIIVSNPPYITKDEYATIGKSVKLYEPQLALIGETEFYEALVHNVVIPSECHSFVFELGNQSQADIVQSLLPHWNIGTMKDSQENLRCVIGSKDKSFMTLCN